MTLPASGALSMSAINTEFALGNNLGAYRGVTWYTDAGATGTFTSTNLGMDQFYSKRKTSPTFSFAIASNTTNANLRTLAVNAGWNQSSAVVATINSGVVVYSTSTGTPALTVNGSFPGGVQLVNNGTILGAGGAGGKGSDFTPSNMTAGGGGGLGLSVSVAVSINNVNRISGGGGGGGGGNRTFFNPGGKGGGILTGSGGGGGGGIGNGAGGATGVNNDPPFSTSGSAGTLTSNGTGGLGSCGAGGAGGNGGSYGAAGSAGGNSAYGVGASGGAAGAAVAGNANITWIAVGTRNGGIS